MTKESFLKEHNAFKGEYGQLFITYKGHLCLIKDLPNALKISPISKEWNIGEGAGESVLIEFPSKTTTMTKRYRLIRDIDFPIESIPKGTLFERGENEIYYSAKGYRANFNREEILDKKWFTEIKEEEPTIVTSLMHCKPSGNLFVFTDNKSGQYSVDGKVLRLLLSHLPEFPPKNSWSDNDMIEFADDRVERVIKKYFHWTSLSVKHDKEDLESFKNKRP